MHDIGVQCLFFVYAVDIGYETLDNHTHARTHTHNNYWKKERIIISKSIENCHQKTRHRIHSLC